MFHTLFMAVIYLALAFGLFAAGKLVYDTMNPSFDLRTELLEKDNFALALAVTGYYLGLVFAIGGAVEGPSVGFFSDVFGILFYGVLAIVLLTASKVICNRFLLHRFDVRKEIIEDRNAGTGVIEAASYVATGLVVYGAVVGEGGGPVTAVVFWALGQAALLAAGFVYNLITPFDVHAEVERDNVAVGVAFAGVLIAVGNVARVGIAGDFTTWSAGVGEFVAFAVVGLAALPLVRLAADRILLPGRSLTDEIVHQDNPNVGAALIEAVSYVAASMLIGWVL